MVVGVDVSTDHGPPATEVRRFAKDRIPRVNSPVYFDLVHKLNTPRMLTMGASLERAEIALSIRQQRGQPITPSEQDEFASILGRIVRDLKALELNHSLGAAQHWESRFKQHDVANYYEGECAINEVKRSVFREISKPVIVFLDQTVSVTADTMKAGVDKLRNMSRFPSTWWELDMAVHCYRMEAYTAATFHSMRAVELVLIKVAESLSVPCGFDQWQVVIEGIEAKIKDLSQLPKGQQKAEQQEFYSVLAKEFRYFKDAWRNHVSHSRTTYDGSKAKEVCSHVLSFVEHAGDRLTE